MHRQAAPISVATYHAMAAQGLVDRRTELLRGVIIEKIIESPLHASIVRRLFRLLSQAAGPNDLVLKEDPITTIDSEPEPDIAVVSGREDDFAEKHPTTARLVAEVAVSSLEIDREKASIYAAAGVGEYWLVLPEMMVVEVHTSPREGIYTERKVFTSTDRLVSAAMPELNLVVRDFFGE